MSTGLLIFLLSPANSAGKRASDLLREDGSSALAHRLRTDGATIGEVYTFMSGLYFRGKLAYSQAFARSPHERPGVQVIVPGLGLCPPSFTVDREQLRAIASVPVDPDDQRYTIPLRQDAERLAEELGPDAIVVLLGSIATPKYLQPLTDILGERLHFPEEFVGRGDMSRGSMMLRCVAEGRELTYVNAVGPIRR